ncbi:hypothetical protein IFR05_010904 [Cadophora sp. M221]|nr:hypothetical protein IFR05_010904 [Cadophora sp. M221]
MTRDLSSLAFARNSDSTSAAHIMQAHLNTEKYLASLAAQGSSFTYTVIRIGLYSESFPIYTAFFDLKNPGDVRIPHNGTGPGIAWVKQDDLGNAMALLLKSFTESRDTFPFVNKIVLLSGPREWSLKETVEALGRVSKKAVKLLEVSVDEYASQPQVQNGLSYGAGDLAEVWATAFEAICRESIGKDDNPEEFKSTQNPLFGRRSSISAEFLACYSAKTANYFLRFMNPVRNTFHARSILHYELNLSSSKLRLLTVNMKVISILSLVALASTLVASNPLSAEVDLEKRASCLAVHAGKLFGGTCVDVRKGKQCVNGLLVTGWCDGGNTIICCIKGKTMCDPGATSGIGDA